MNDKEEDVKIGFCGILAAIFITLKLTNKIVWPWIWVVSPLWIPIAIWLFLLGGTIIFLAVTRD